MSYERPAINSQVFGRDTDVSSVISLGTDRGELIILRSGEGVRLVRNAANDYTISNVGVMLAFAVSDETTALTAGTSKLTFRAPYAFQLTNVRGSLNTVSSSGLVTVNIKKNGSTIFGANKLTIDASEKTSVTAATAHNYASTPITFADDDEITFDIDAAGTGAKGLKVVLYGIRT